MFSVNLQPHLKKSKLWYLLKAIISSYPYQTWRDGIGVDVGSLQFRGQTVGKLPLGGFKDLVGIEVGGGSRGGDKDHASPIPFSHVGQERGGE